VSRDEVVPRSAHAASTSTSMKWPSMRARSLGVTAVLAAQAVLGVGLASRRGLSADEALYACEAARAAPWRWPDHPPLLGLLLRPLLALHRWPLELRVRAVSIACALITTLAIASLAERWAPAANARRARALGAWLASFGLMPAVGLLITTPDAPLIASISLLLVMLSRPDGAPGASLTSHRLAQRDLVIVCALAACASLSKVAALPVVSVLAIGCARRGRVRTAIALFFGMALTLPWTTASLSLQLAHVVGRGPIVSAPYLGPLGAIVAWASAQLGLWSPPLLVLALASDAARPPAGARAALRSVLAVLAASALVSGRPPEPGWSAVVMPIALPLAAVALARARHARLRLPLVAFAAAPALVAWALFANGSVLGPLARIPRADERDRAVGAEPGTYAAWAHRCAEKLR
jgi:hypothetical protein